jgi:hypothetical protein
LLVFFICYYFFMKMTQREITPRKKARWSAGVLLAGFLLGSLLPSLNWRVQAAPHRAVALDVVINEVAWMGTSDNWRDEWIELHNPTSSSIDLTGWVLTDGDDIDEVLNGVIPANGYYLLERSSDTNVSDELADFIYSGYLSNIDEILTLKDSGDNTIDTANLDSGDWPAGDNTTKASMERIAVIADSPTAWADNNGITVNGLDANSNPLRATPKQPNSVSYLPLSIVINEVAWAGTEAYFGDEWIELYNPSAYPISLDGWRLASDSGSVDIFLSGTLNTGAYLLLERGVDGNATNVIGQTYDSGLLEDTGDTLRLLSPDRTEIDTANNNGGGWPNGRLSPPSSMERMASVADADDIWVTNPHQHATARDAAGNAIYGTPGEVNWGLGAVHTPTPTLTASLTVLINEVAWAGTNDGINASVNDEWIELYNHGSVDIDLTGWRLKATDGAPDIALSGIITAGGYYLLERSDDDTISDIAADLIYSGALEDGGEYLELFSSSGNIVDTANKAGGAWPSGSKSPNYGSMERAGIVEDSASAWLTHAGTGNGLDADGEQINGTPRQPNWSFNVTATPSPVPTRTPIQPSATPTPFPFQSVVLNEVLPRPGYDWNEDGVVNAHDEYIEIINRGSAPFNLEGWQLDDEYELDSTPYTLPNVELAAGQRIAIFGYTSHIALSDGGDTVRLLKNNGQIADVITYTVIKAADQSWCRYPEDSYWRTDCFPTPNDENSLQGRSVGILPAYTRPACSVPDTVPEIISFVECGDLGININDADFWNHDLPEIWLTGHAKKSTWFR